MITAALVYTQYWAFYLVGVVARGAARRRVARPSRAVVAALRVVAAIAVGVLLLRAVDPDVPLAAGAHGHAVG